MIQFTYQPAFDPFHSVYRVLRVRDLLNETEIDKARIIDFYLLFPFRLSEVVFKKEDQGCRKIAQIYECRRGYAIQPAARALFTSMRPVYDAAAQTMASEGYLDGSDFTNGYLTVTTKAISGETASRVIADNEAERDLLECLGQLLEYELLGPKGLKARTGLMEHRNDAP